MDCPFCGIKAEVAEKDRVQRLRGKEYTIPQTPSWLCSLCGEEWYSGYQTEKLLRKLNNVLLDKIEKLEEYEWMYKDLCK